MNFGEKQDGYYHGQVMGTYLHGVFDEEDFRNAFLQILCEKKGIDDDRKNEMSFEEYRQQQYDLLADALRESLSMNDIYRILEEGV